MCAVVVLADVSCPGLAYAGVIAVRSSGFLSALR
jgi:hypothetical protein